MDTHQQIEWKIYRHIRYKAGEKKPIGTHWQNHGCGKCIGKMVFMCASCETCRTKKKKRTKNFHTSYCYGMRPSDSGCI